MTQGQKTDRSNMGKMMTGGRGQTIGEVQTMNRREDDREQMTDNRGGDRQTADNARGEVTTHRGR